MKRIAVIATNEFDAFAGSELLWSQTALRLAESGRAVSVNVPAWPELPERMAQLARRPEVVFRQSPNHAPVWRRLVAKAAPAFVPAYFARYRERFLRQTRPDLVVISQGGCADGADWMESCVRLGIGFVAIVHGVWDPLWPSQTLADKAAACYPYAKAVFFVCEHNRLTAERQLGVTLPNARIVRNPFNASYDVPPGWPEEDGILRLACVGRLGAENKGQDLLVEVMASPKWAARPLLVTLVGKGHHRPLLERLIAMRGCRNVQFAGYTNDLESIWRQHHALVMPSRYEGLPVVLVEAMLCHRTAIVTDVGGNTELIEDGATGFVAPAPTLHFVEEAMERAWVRRQEWRRMGELAGQRVRALVPRDPVHVFVEELKAILAK
jgi:glycosyltransferase involved in cell wall biosynthesis